MPMDAAGAEALRQYLASRNGGHMPTIVNVPVNGTALKALELWFKTRDEHTDPSLDDVRRDR